MRDDGKGWGFWGFRLILECWAFFFFYPSTQSGLNEAAGIGTFPVQLHPQLSKQTRGFISLCYYSEQANVTAAQIFIALHGQDIKKKPFVNEAIKVKGYDVLVSPLALYV